MNNVSIIIGAFAFVTGLFVAFSSNLFAKESDDPLKTLVFQENETREYLLKQTQAGDVEAMFKYSSRCKDLKESAKWLTKSALNGYARAQFYLGVLYTEGRSVEIITDADKSKEWLTKSSRQGFPMAKVYCLYKGIGVKADKDKAWNVLQNSAKAGYVESQYFLATIYKGTSAIKFSEIEENEEKAQYWMEKAAESGFCPAQMNLASIYYEQGRYKESVKWFKNAAIQGDAYSQYRLAWVYYEGKGVKKNLAEAKKWTQKAADQGINSAKRLLDIIKKETSDANPVDDIFE